MTTLIITIAIALGAVWYFIRIGKNLEKASGLRAALGIHGKINRAKEKIEKEHRKRLARKSKGDFRDFFNSRH